MSRDTRFERLGGVSNAHVGQAFEELALRVLDEHGLELQLSFPLEIGVATIKKERKFDLGSSNPAVLVECKTMTFTTGGKVPSAKINAWEKEMYFFHLAPPEYRKIMFVLRSTRTGYSESLAEYFLRLKAHLIPPDVEFWEYDPETETVTFLETPVND